MIRRRHRRTVQIESLESRHLLSGLVRVALTDGHLTLTGDEADNAVRVQEVSPQEALGSTLVIRPVDQTLLEFEGKVFPGTLRIPDVELTGMKWIPGAGQDDFRLHQVEIGGNLRVENSAGRDFYQVSDSVVEGKMQVVSETDIARTVLRDSRIGPLDKASAPLLRVLSTHNTSLVAARLKVAGSASASLDGKGNDVLTEEIRLSDVDLDGRLDIVTSRSTSINLTRVNVAQKVNVAMKKAEETEVDNPQLSRLVIRETNVAGALHVATAQKVRLDMVDSTAQSIRLHSSHKNQEAISTANLARVSTDNLRIGAESPLSLRVRDSKIKENATADSTHKDEIDVLSWSWGFHNTDIGGRLSVRSHQGSLRVSGTDLKARAVFAKYDEIKGDSNEESEGPRTSHLSLNRASISGPLTIQSAQKVNIAIRDTNADRVGINVEIAKPVPANKATPALMQASLNGVRVRRGLHVATDAGGTLSLRESVIGGRTHWIDKSSANHRMQAAVTDTSIGGALTVESKVAPLQVSTNRVHADHMYLKIYTSRDHKNDQSRLSIRATDIAGTLSVETAQKVRLDAVDTTAQSIRLLSSHKNQEAISTANLTRVSTGNLRISAESPLSLRVRDSKIARNATADSTHKDEIDVLSWSWGFHNTDIGGRLSVRSHQGSLRVSGTDLKARAVFAKYGEIKGESNDESDGPRTSRLSLNRASIAGPLTIQSAQKVNIAIRDTNADRVGINVEIAKPVPANKATPALMQASLNGVRVRRGLHVATNAGGTLSLRESVIGGRTHWIDKSSANHLMQAAVTDTSIGGALTVESKVAPLRMSTNRVHTGDMFVKVNTAGDHKNDQSRLSIRATDIGGTLSVETAQKVRLDAVDTTAQSIRLHSSHKNQEAISTANLTRVSTGNLRISTESPLSLRVRDSKIARDATADSKHKDEIDVLSWSWGFHNTDIGGRLSVRSHQGSLRVSTNAVRAGDIFVKIKPSKVAAQNHSQLSLRSTDIAGRLSVQSAQKVQLNIVDTTAGFIEQDNIYKQQNVVSRTSLTRVQAGRLRISTLSPLSLRVRDSQVEGDATADSKHKNEIDILSWSWGFHDTSVGGRLTVRSSSALRFAGTGLEAGAVFMKYGEIKGEANAANTSASIVLKGSKIKENLVVETGQPTFVSVSDTSTGGGQTFRMLSGDTQGSTLRLTRVDVGGGLRVSSNASLNASLRDSSVRGQVYYKVTMKNLMVTSISTSHTTVGALQVISVGGVMRMHVDGVSAGSGDIRLQAGSRNSGGAGGHVRIRNSEFSGRLRIESREPQLTLNLSNTQVGGHLRILTDGRAGETSRLNLVGVTANSLGIQGGAEDTHICIADQIVRTRTRINTGGGNDQLAILDSVFGGAFHANGGLGEDLLVIRRSKFGGRRILRNWEKIVES